MRGDTAHGHTPYIRDIPGSKVQIQKQFRLTCILAVHFKEITDLIQHYIVRVCFLDGVIAVVGGVSRHILCLRLIIKRLFVRCKIAVHPNQLRDTRSDLVPIHLNICTARFFQRDAFAAVIFIAAIFSRYSMGVSADPIFFFQEIGALLGRVRSLEKRIDAGLSTLKAASICKRSRDFIFGNKSACFRNSHHVGVIFFTWQGQFFQSDEKCLRSVVMETQQLSVFAVSIHKDFVFRQKPFPKYRVCHIVRQQLPFFRVIGAANIAHTGHIPQRFCFIRKIVIKFPNFGGNTQALVPGCFCDLQIGGKCAAAQQFFRALRRVRPAYHLGGAKIARDSASSNVNPILTIPCGKPAVIRNQAVAAVVKSFQKCRAIL